jgi:hypothetical protein
MKINSSSAYRETANSAKELANAQIEDNAEQSQVNQLLAAIEGKRAVMSELLTLQEEHRLLRTRKVSPLLHQYYAANEKIVLFLSDRLKDPVGLSIKQQDDVAHIGLALLKRLTNAGRSSHLLQEPLQRFAAHQSAKEETQSAQLNTSEVQPSQAEPSRFSFDTDQAFQKPKRRERKKSKVKADLCEAAVEVPNTPLALRSVYRKLVSALHPDRAADEADRLHKTLLMTRANTANDRGDLSELIHLQTQVMGLDSKYTLNPERLQAFRRELRQQLEQLLRDQRTLEQTIREEFGLSYGAINRKTLKVAARAEISGLQQSLDSSVNTIQHIQTHRNFKNWLKQQVQLFED